MSNPNPPPCNRGLANLERTRQQLQELDSLLQQMLALPLAEQPTPPAPATEAPAPPAAPAKVEETPGPKRLQTLASARLVSADGDVSPDLKRPLPLPVLIKAERQSVEPAAPPARPVPVAEPARGIPADFDPALMDLSGPATFDAGHDHELDNAPRRWGSGAVKAPVRRPLVYRTFVDFNLMFDRTVGLLGPLGRPLTSESGKAWLGWIGLMSLGGAIALALGMWLGWSW